MNEYIFTEKFQGYVLDMTDNWVTPDEEVIGSTYGMYWLTNEKCGSICYHIFTKERNDD